LRWQRIARIAFGVGPAFVHAARCARQVSKTAARRFLINASRPLK
jgi:hypothetical protein